MYSVYALTDPRDETIRYIGMSKNVWRRYAMHLLIPAKAAPTKTAWIEELRQIDLSPLLTILETAETEAEARKRETYWIQCYLKLNAPLTNMLKTGKAFPNRESLADLSPTVRTLPAGFLTVEQIAGASGVTSDTVWRLIRQKELVAYRIAGSLRIHPDDLQKYLDKQKTDQTE